MDSEDRLNLWFKTASGTAGVFGDIGVAIYQPNWFDIATHESVKAELSAILVGNQVVLSVADPIDGEQVPGMVESVRFNAGTLEYGVAGTWTIVPGATGLERSLLADDGTIFNKSQDGVTYTKVVPGEWLMLPTDGGMFANVASDPGSVLLGVYDSSVTPTPPSGGSGSGGGANNPPIVTASVNGEVFEVRYNSVRRNGTVERLEFGSWWSVNDGEGIAEGFVSLDGLLHVALKDGVTALNTAVKHGSWSSESMSTYLSAKASGTSLPVVSD